MKKIIVTTIIMGLLLSATNLCFGENSSDINREKLQTHIYSLDVTPSEVLGDIRGGSIFLTDGKFEFTPGVVIKTQEYKTDIHSLGRGWPQQTSGSLNHISKIIIEDLDGDGNKDVIVDCYDGKIYAWDYTGDNLSGWPVVSSTFMNGHVAPSSVGDLDNDGDMELVSSPKDLYSTSSGTNISLLSAWDHEGNMLPNFPIWIEYPQNYGLFWWTGYDNPVLIDLDNDGDLEIIVGIAICENDGSGWISNWKFFAYHHNGTIVDGWPFIVQKEGDETPSCGGTPAAADVDNDGEIEVVVAINLIGDTEIWGRLYLLDRNGSIEEGNWPIVTNDFIYSAPALADFDFDGDYEIVFGSSMDDSRFFVVDHFGNNLPGWPRDDLGYLSLVSAPAIGDLDGDGIPEIIQANGAYWNNKVFAWHIDGSDVNGWPVSFYPGYSTWCSPVIGDITGDDTPEIVVGNSDNKFYAWHCDGTRVKGWPKVVDNTTFVTPAIADLNNDGITEIIVASWSGYVDVWNFGTSYHPSTMFWPQFHHNAQHTGCYKPFNNPPNAPKISGPSICKPGTEYNYTFVSTEPDGDEISEYIVNWGDGNVEIITGPFTSGAPVTKSHTWTSKGIYIIKARAKDIHGAESDWGIKFVTMPLDLPGSQQSNPQSNPSPQNQPGSQQSIQLLQNLIVRQQTTK